MPSIFLRHLDIESIIIEREYRTKVCGENQVCFVAADVIRPMALTTVKLLVSILSRVILAKYEKDNRE